MNGIKYAILSHGFVENDAAWNFALAKPGTVDNRYPKPDWRRSPSYSVLIEHPEEGYILYDTGSCPGDEKNRRPKESSDAFFLDIKREEFLDSRLASLNLKPDDISIVIVSHMHWDHCGGLTFFSNTKAGQNVIVGKPDYTAGLVETHKSPLDNGVGWIKEDFGFEGLTFNLIEEDQTLVSGVDLIMLEGHTPSVVGLMLHVDSGTVIFTSDAVNTAKNYGPPPVHPGIEYDSLGFERTIKKLYLLQKKYNAKMMYGHDDVQFATLKIAPYFYK